MITVLATIAGCVVLCCTMFGIAFAMVTSEREQIYVIDGEIPFLAERAQLETTYEIEAKAHVNLFHQYFFNLPPDNEYIEYSIEKALYLADGSALKQKHLCRKRDSSRTWCLLPLCVPLCAIPLSSIMMTMNLPTTVLRL